MATNAGPQPQTALDMPSRAVSIGRTRPIFEKSASTCRHSPSESEWRRSQTTMPSQTETGRIGNDAQMVRAGGEHPLAVVERNARGHRNDDLIRQLFPDGRKHRLDLIGVSRRRRPDRRTPRPPPRRRKPGSPAAPVLRRSFARSRAHAPMSPGCTAPSGQTRPPWPAPISESKKSDFHISLV